MRSDRTAGTGILTVLLLISSLCLSSVEAVAQDEFVPVYHPELTIRRATGPIKIDGFLEDEGWRGAAKADNFAEHNPGDQTKPEVDTEVLITYDDEYLYVAWICYDDPSEVRSQLCERDQIFSGDYVILCIDPYGEATLAYEIAANPYGIPGDLLYSSTHGEDISYDMIFESEGRITESGYVVEMAIPFQNMRFPDREEQVWRMDFWRNRPRESRFQYSWAAYDRDEDCWPCNWGTVKGISGAKAGKGFKLLPALVAYQSGSLNDDGEFENSDIKGELSLGASYDISSELTTEITINPDFSQVESDAAQIDVNSTFALFYPEKRPFFQEGSDLFKTYYDAVYTRSINDPSVAGKLTWRSGSNSLAFLTARDEHSVVILPFEENSRFVENGKSYSNIVRMRRDLGEQSHLGLVATDRRFDSGGSGTAAGVDGKIRLSASNSILFQALATYTEEIDNPALTDSAFNEETFDGGKYTKALDGETFWGHAFLTNIQRSTSDYWFGAEYSEKSPTFRVDNGFEPSNNYRYGNGWMGGILRFDDSDVLENINGSFNFGRKWNFDGVQKDEWLNADLSVRFRTAQSEIHASYMASNELFQNIQFNGIWQGHICLHTQPNGSLNFGGNYNYGHRIARHDLVMGKETRYGVWADIRPIDRMLLSASYSHIFSDGLDSGERLFSQSIFRSTLSLQFTRELSLRVIAQYNDRWEVWDIDPLIKYRLNSFSVFYIGSTNRYRNMTLDEDPLEGWHQTDRQYFLKFQYLFQL
jgi:hypothetical protein